MDIETTTVFTDYLVDSEIELTVRHDLAYELGFRLKVGCVDEYINVADLQTVHRVIAAGLRKYKAQSK